LPQIKNQQAKMYKNMLHYSNNLEQKIGLFIKTKHTWQTKDAHTLVVGYII